MLFDPMPFDGIENIDDLTLREAAVWGCIYIVSYTHLDVYKRQIPAGMAFSSNTRTDLRAHRLCRMGLVSGMVSTS